MPTKRGVHLHNLTIDSLAFTLSFDNAAGGWHLWAEAAGQISRVHLGRRSGGAAAAVSKGQGEESIWSFDCSSVP